MFEATHLGAEVYKRRLDLGVGQKELRLVMVDAQSTENSFHGYELVLELLARSHSLGQIG